MKTKILLAFFIAVFSMSITGNLNAQNHKGTKQCSNSKGLNPHKCMGQMLPGITDEQKAKIKKIHLNLKKELMPLQNKMAEKKAHLKTLATAENVDANAVNTTIDEIAALKAQMMKKQMAAKQEMRKLLNEEQRLIFDSKFSMNGHGNCGNGHKKRQMNCNSHSQQKQGCQSHGQQSKCSHAQGKSKCCSK